MDDVPEIQVAGKESDDYAIAAAYFLDGGCYGVIGGGKVVAVMKSSKMKGSWRWP